MNTEDKINSLVNVMIEILSTQLEFEKAKLIDSETSLKRAKEWNFLETSREKETNIKKKSDIFEKQKIVVQTIDEQISKLKEGGC